MIRHVTFIFLMVIVINAIHAQNPSCPNIDFESGTLANWNGATGICCPIIPYTNGLVIGRHTIMSGNGIDTNSLNDIPVVAPGGGMYSVRLGNANLQNEAEILNYTITVTPQSSLFIFRYAIVFEDPVHLPGQQPRFEIQTKDQLGNNLACGTFNFVCDTITPGYLSNQTIRYKKWSAGAIDLSYWMGQSVTVEFRTGDCALGGHFGYAYIDCWCG